jgi:RNA ligase (TIGR02306 family)
VIGFIQRLYGKLVGRGADIAARLSRTDTEFTAEVVRVTQVLPHPGADRLEIARFELHGASESGYEVVIQKGSAKVGDLKAYFSVDCILPLAHPEFAFLASRLDGAGKTHYKLRAARLRGVFSQGLLVDAPDTHAFGDRVDETFGVTYYRDPEPATKNGPTAKSSTPRKQPFPIYGVDSLKKVPRLFNEGEPVLITEKIHGTNFRFGHVRRRFLGIPIGWKFVVGSHRVVKDASAGRGFYGEDLWTQAAERMDLARKTKDYPGHTFYGELYGYTYSGQRIQDLTYGRVPNDGPGLAVFDVLAPGGRWLGPLGRAVVCTDCDLPEVPYVAGTNRADVAKELAEGKSLLAPNQIREGVVVESVEGPRRKAKYVGQGYLMREGA